MADKKSKVDKNDQVYSHIVINKTTRFSVIVATCIIYGLVFINMGALVAIGTDWTTIIWSSSAFASFLVFVPRSEHWKYTPWQKQAQKYEFHYID